MFPLSLLISLVYQIFTENKSIYFLFHFVSVLLIKFLFTELCQYKIRLENLPYEHIRWIANKDEVDVAKITGTSDMKKVTDLKGNPQLL